MASLTQWISLSRNKLPQTQQLQTTQMHDFIEVWYRSHQSKIKVSAGLWSFPEAPEDVSLLIWIFGKIQFFGCYGTEVPFPCCLSAESCFYFHPLACGLFLHFQSQQQPYEAVRLTRGFCIALRDFWTLLVFPIHPGYLQTRVALLRGSQAPRRAVCGTRGPRRARESV